MITLHVGLHKTGSSSIQLFLEHWSAPAGTTVVVPRAGNEHDLPSIRRRFEAVADHRQVIWSDENLLGTPFDGYRDAPERIRLIHEFLRSRGGRVIVYVRPQFTWLPSVYTQLVQIGGTASSSDFWAGIRESPWLRWSALVSHLRDALGAENVAVIAYAPQSAVLDFCTVTGIPPSDRAEEYRENASITAVQVPLLAAVNALTTSTSARHLARSRFQLELRPGAARGFSVFPSDVQQDILDTFRQDWQQLADLASTDQASRFAEIVQSWPTTVMPFAGDDIHHEPVAAEALRSLALLSGTSPEDQRTGMLSRVARAARHPRRTMGRIMRVIRAH